MLNTEEVGARPQTGDQRLIVEIFAIAQHDELPTKKLSEMTSLRRNLNVEFSADAIEKLPAVARVQTSSTYGSNTCLIAATPAKLYNR